MSFIAGDHPLLLGSASPRRREILARLGIPVVVHPVGVDEAVARGERVDGYLERVVAAKHRVLAAQAKLDAVAALLVADTAVVVGERILGKPSDDREARTMLVQLSGREHRVCTRFAVAAATDPGRVLAAQTVESIVRFRELSDDHVARYVATGEGRDKAGAYAVQGIGAFAVEHVVGSYSNVVGLPACQVVAALERTGLLEGFPLARQTDP